MRVGVVANATEHFKYSWPEMAIGLESQGHTLFFAAGDQGVVGEGRKVEHLRGITRRPSLKCLAARASLVTWIESNAIDLIIVNNAVPAAVVRLLAPRDLPIVYFAHGLHWASEEEWRSMHWRWIERLLLLRTAAVVTLNQDDETWFSKFNSELPSLRLPFGVGVDLERFTCGVAGQGKPKGGAIKLIWISELNERKRPELACRIVEKINGRGLECSLTILGDGKLLAKAKRVVGELNMEHLINFAGKVDPVPYYKEADALIHTATWEGYPRVFLEAMAMGKPIFSFDIKGARGVPGINLVHDGDLAGFAQEVDTWWRSGGSTADPSTRSLLSSRNAGVEIGKFLHSV